MDRPRRRHRRRGYIAGSAVTLMRTAGGLMDRQDNPTSYSFNRSWNRTSAPAASSRTSAAITSAAPPYAGYHWVDFTWSPSRLDVRRGTEVPAPSNTKSKSPPQGNATAHVEPCKTDDARRSHLRPGSISDRGCGRVTDNARVRGALSRHFLWHGRLGRARGAQPKITANHAVLTWTMFRTRTPVPRASVETEQSQHFFTLQIAFPAAL